MAATIRTKWKQAASTRGDVAPHEALRRPMKLERFIETQIRPQILSASLSGSARTGRPYLLREMQHRTRP